MRTFATMEALARLERRQTASRPRTATPPTRAADVDSLAPAHGDAVGKKPSEDVRWEEDRCGFTACRKARP